MLNWLGKEETGKPIPHKQIKVFKKIKSLEWLASIEFPISKVIGINKTLATVWLMKVEIIKTKNPKMIVIGHRLNPLKTRSIKTSMSSNNPDDNTDLPNAIPLIAKNTIDQGYIRFPFMLAVQFLRSGMNQKKKKKNELK